jgi:hypothetical protein
VVDKATGSFKLAELPDVAAVTVTCVELELLSFTEAGETEHVDCAGAPAHARVTA